MLLLQYLATMTAPTSCYTDPKVELNLPLWKIYNATLLNGTGGNGEDNLTKTKWAEAKEYPEELIELSNPIQRIQNTR
jgi:hypothetical protein